MTTSFTPVELAHLKTHLPSAISTSMLDGYLAAVSSGPSFVMPDKVLRWVWDAGRADQLTTDLIIRQYQAVNDTLNDRVYEPVLTDQQAWCRGYLAGFVADMTAWAPMTAALPDSIVPFQISQRADYIENDFFEWVQHNRAIVNTRDEPLADPNQYRRIHLLCGDSNMAEYATALKMGTTGLVLQLIEAGQAPRGLGISEPVEALQEISRDPERQWIVRLESGQSISAIDVQEQFLAAARRHCQGQDEETDWVLDQWESVLTGLRGGYEALVGRIDCASKLWLLDTYRDAEQVAWDDPMLKSLDLEYHNLHPERGLCYGLEEEGRGPRLTTDKVVQLAQDHPPRNTRAFGRGELVRHLLAGGGAGPEMASPPEYDDHASYDYIINWSNFKLRGAAPFFMADPFKTYVQDVRGHLAGRSAFPNPENPG